MEDTTRPPLGTTLLTYAKHYDYNYTLAWSPDGESIVSVNSYHGAIEMWSAATGQRLALCPPLPVIHIAAWSPDGISVALAQYGVPGTVSVWHPQTNEIISTNLDGGHENWSSSLGWSPDATRIASSSHQQSIQVWDVQTGAGIYNYLSHTTTITGVAWSPNGNFIASASIDGVVLVWDAVTGETLTTFRQHREGTTAIAWSPDSTYLASACSSEVFVWEASTGKIITACQHEARGQISVAWSPDGKRVASNAFSGVAIVWDAFSGEILCIYDEPTANGSDIAWSPDGQTIASAGQGVFVWDAWSGETRLVRGEPSEVSDAKPSPNGKYVASMHSGPLQIWNAQTGERLGTCNDHDAYSLISAFDWSPDSRHLATAHIYGALVVWKEVGESGQPREIQVYHESGDPHNQADHAFARDVAWSPDGKCLACTRNGFIEIWDVATQERYLIYQGHAEPPERQKKCLVWSLSWSPDSQRIASCDEKSMQVWNASSGELLLTYDAQEAGLVSAYFSDVEVPDVAPEYSGFREPPGFRRVAWSPDGTSLAVAFGSTIHVWQAISGQTITMYRGHQQKVSTLAWSPDSTTIASGEDQGRWNWFLNDDDSGQNQVFSLSPAGQTVHLWRVGQDEKEPYYIYRGHPSHQRVSARIRDIHWFSDGERIASANREVQIWQAR
jgi:WD40 repeat protein